MCRSWWSYVPLCLVAVCVMWTRSGAAKDAEAVSEEVKGLSLKYSNLSVVRLNPLGLQDQLDIDATLELYDDGGSKLLAGNFVSLGVSPILSPALVRLGAALKLRPLAVLRLEVRWDYINFFGNFDLVQSFDDPYAEFSDTQLEENGEEGLNYGTDGWQVTLDLEVRAKVWRVIVRSRVKLAYVDMALKGGDTVFYDQYYDLLLPHEGWLMTNDADLLFEVTPRLIVGVRYAYQHVFYGDELFPTGAEETDASPVHRLGPLVAYSFYDEPGAVFNKPTVLVLLGWYLDHKYRTGEDVSQAFPYTVLGFAFSGTLM